MRRATCYACGRSVPVAPPSGGDGSADVYRRHRTPDGDVCPASRDFVDAK